MAAMRIILHGKAAGDARVRTAVHAVRQNGHFVEVRVTWEPGDAARLTAEAVADAGAGKVGCIVAGGGDGTINEVFATAYGAGLPEQCSLGVLPLGTANDFAHATGVPVQDLTAALQLATGTPPRWIDVGVLNSKPFINLVSGGFGSRVLKPIRSSSGAWADLPMCSPASRALPSSRRTVAAFVRKASLGKDLSWPLRSATAGRPEAACRFARTLCSMTAGSI